MADAELKPVQKLTPEQQQRVVEAIVDAFSPQELQQALRFKWGLVLGTYFNVAQGFIFVVGELVAWTERQGKTRDLVLLMLFLRPDNPSVQQIAAELGITLAAAQQKYDPQQLLATPKPPTLEALVLPRSRFVDFGKFLSRFAALGDRICQVQTPYNLGSGFLVGPDLVLTNFHVVGQVTTATDAAKIICRFDYHQVEETSSTLVNANKPQESRLTGEWLVASSPSSENDLDYALLRLTENVGHAPSPSRKTRGWFDLKAERPLLAVRDFAVIPQHAKGDPLVVAWGEVLGFNEQTTRVKYDTQTAEGSSGSPCLTVDLDIFGLHHAGRSGKYNQAVPLDLIAKDLKQKGLAWEH